MTLLNNNNPDMNIDISRSFVEYLTYLIGKKDVNVEDILKNKQHIYDTWFYCSRMYQSKSSAAAIERLNDTKNNDGFLNLEILGENIMLKEQLSKLTLETLIDFEMPSKREVNNYLKKIKHLTINTIEIDILEKYYFTNDIKSLEDASKFYPDMKIKDLEKIFNKPKTCSYI